MISQLEGDFNNLLVKVICFCAFYFDENRKCRCVNNEHGGKSGASEDVYGIRASSDVFSCVSLLAVQTYLWLL